MRKNAAREESSHAGSCKRNVRARFYRRRFFALFAWIFLPLSFARCQQAAKPAQAATPVRVADAACAKCHQQIYESYLATPMANASGLAASGAIPGGFTDKASGIEYGVSVEDGSAWLAYERPGVSELRGKQRLQYFLGSGAHARTYLYAINGHWFESPAVYYAEKHGYDIRPSFRGDSEMPFNLPMNEGCLRCHVSGTRQEDPGTLNHYSRAPFLHVGIACEACHGDATQHMASGGKIPLVDLSKLDGERRDAVCLNCHLEGDSNIEHRGRSLLNFQPGEKIVDYASYYVRAGAGATNRGVSQVEALDLSMCKRMSGDRMTCTTCHDPHYTPAAAERVSYFRQKCLGCHSERKYAKSHYSGTPDCASCHMPQKEAPDLAHSEWTDHRILRRPEAAAPSNSANQPELVPVPGIREAPNARDLALAYYTMVENGNTAFADRAWMLLQNAEKADPRDTDVLIALGFLAEVRNDRDQASEYYEMTLQQDPNRYTAAMNLAVLLARAGKLRAAADLWQTTFARNEDITELGMHVATARCMLGDKTAAEGALRQVLIYSPDHQAAREELNAIESGERACPAR
jgi:predicted CXXCH cytochrome family protein